MQYFLSGSDDSTLSSGSLWGFWPLSIVRYVDKITPVFRTLDVSVLKWIRQQDRALIVSDTEGCNQTKHQVNCAWNVMTHAQKPDFVFRQNGRVHLNRRGRQFSRLLAAGVCASAVVMLDTPCSEVVWRVLATHTIRQFPLHFPSRASPCAITLQLDSSRITQVLLKLKLSSARHATPRSALRTWPL